MYKRKNRVDRNNSTKRNTRDNLQLQNINFKSPINLQYKITRERMMKKDKAGQKRNILSPGIMERRQLRKNRTYFSPKVKMSKNSTYLSHLNSTINPNNYFTFPENSRRPSPKVRVFNFEGSRRANGSTFKSPQPKSSFRIPKIVKNFKLGTKRSPKEFKKIVRAVTRKIKFQRDTSVNTRNPIKNTIILSPDADKSHSNQMARV
jgi:hypothetical protein